MSDVYSVLIADDHPVFREGLRVLVQAEADLEVVAEASDGDQILELARSHKPDVAILDLSMSSRSVKTQPVGLAFIEPLKDMGINVLVLTMHDASDLIGRALAHGAYGYLVKHSSSSEILKAIRAVARGATHVHATPSPPGLKTATNEINLSRREQEVLTLIALGHTNAEAAQLLNISVKTVEGYRARLMKKLEITKRVELVKKAMELGVLTAG